MTSLPGSVRPQRAGSQVGKRRTAPIDVYDQLHEQLPRDPRVTDATLSLEPCPGDL